MPRDATAPSHLPDPEALEAGWRRYQGRRGVGALLRVVKSTRRGRRWLRVLRLLIEDVLAFRGLRAARRRSRINGIVDEYPAWIRGPGSLQLHQRAAIRRHLATLGPGPTISVLMPAFETDPRLLTEAIESVLAQLYPDWELCVVDDGSSSPHVAEIVQSFAAIDPRVRLEILPDNRGIVAASAAALTMARGEWIALLDHDDLLEESALYRVATTALSHPEAVLIYSDEDHISLDGLRSMPHLKTAFDYDRLLQQNYLNHLTAIRTDRAREVGGFRPGYEGSQDWDLLLRVVAGQPDAAVVHLPFVLYHWRQSAEAFSSRAIEVARESALKAVRDHLAQTQQSATVTASGISSYLEVRWRMPEPEPSVAVIIPTRDQVRLLRRSVGDVLDRTDYARREVIIVDNGSRDRATLTYLAELAGRDDVTVIRDDEPFNFSRLVNRGVAATDAEICVLLNNDIGAIEDHWLRELVAIAVRPGIGAVGAKLRYDDDRLQHAGVVLGIKGVAGHDHRGRPVEESGYFDGLRLVRRFSAVTAACLAIRRTTYLEVGGFDETNLAVAFNDVDFCLRVLDAGYANVWTPHADLYHFESRSRGSDTTAERLPIFQAEIAYMLTRWGDRLRTDPYWSPNLSLDDERLHLADAPRVVQPWEAAGIHLPGGRQPITVPTDDRDAST